MKTPHTPFIKSQAHVPVKSKFPDVGWLRAGGLATALLAGTGAGTANAQQYSIDILIEPYHPEFVDSWLFDINNLGQSTGYIIRRTNNHVARYGCIYQDGAVQLLESVRTVYGINNLGDIVANDVNFGPYFFAAGGEAGTPILFPDSFASLSPGQWPGGVNDSGSSLISVYPNDTADTPPDAFSGLAIWNRAGTEMLSVLDPLFPYTNAPDPEDPNSGPSSFAYSGPVTRLNNADQFSANIHVSDYDPKDPVNPDDDISTDSFTVAYIYNGHGGYNLLESPVPGEEIRPIDIDEGGTVLGWKGSQLALWDSNGALVKLLPDAGTALSESGYGSFPTVQRNNKGTVLAVTAAGGVLSYDPLSNTWADITPSIEGFGTSTFSTIQGFNDVGQFVGLVRPPAGGGVFGYVVSPIVPPEIKLAVTPGGINVSWDGKAIGWTLQRSGDLSPWADIGTTISAADSYLFIGGDSSQFFRLYKP